MPVYFPAFAGTKLYCLVTDMQLYYNRICN